MAVTRQRPLKNPGHIPRALLLAPDEFLHTVVPSHRVQIRGRRRRHAVEVGVIADVMTPQRGDDVAAASLLECARLLAGDLEGPADASFGQDARNAQRRSVAFRREVVFGVEPEYDVRVTGPCRRDETR